MALIKCPECGKEVSDRATACPNCGCPIENEAEKHKYKLYHPIFREKIPILLRDFFQKFLDIQMKKHNGLLTKGEI